LFILTPSYYTLETLRQHILTIFTNTIAAAPLWVRMAYLAIVSTEPHIGQLVISNKSLLQRGLFYIWSDEDIQKESFFSAWTGGIYNVLFPGTCNRLLKNFTTKPNGISSPFRSGFIDLLTHHTIYIRSAQLGTFQNIGPQGERDILKKIMVSVPFGDLITDSWLKCEDFTDCSRLSIQTTLKPLC